MELVLKPVDELPDMPRTRGVNQAAAATIMEALTTHQGGPLLALRGPRFRVDAVRRHLRELGKVDAVVKGTEEKTVDGWDVFELYVRSEPF